VKVPAIMLGALLGLVTCGALCRIGEGFARSALPPEVYAVLLFFGALFGAGVAIDRRPR
jgi:hypothetical protein